MKYQLLTSGQVSQLYAAMERMVVVELHYKKETTAGFEMHESGRGLGEEELLCSVTVRIHLNSRNGVMAFASYAAVIRSLVLVLVLALTVGSSPHGRVAHSRPSKNSGSVRLSEDCLNQNNLKFPATVKVDVRISNSDHAFRVVHDVRNRSLSPWDYRLDEDPNRFPQVIADAKCRLSSCVNPLGQEDHSLNSVPIQQEILVLRREQQGCQSTYRLEKKVITVGCTCVAPVIHHQS